MIFGKAAGPQINFIDETVGLLQGCCCLGIIRYLLKATIGSKAKRHPRLI